MFDQLTNTETDAESDHDDRDRIFNTETRRALRRGIHQLRTGATGVGVFAVMVGLAGLTTLLAIHGTLSANVAVGITLAVTLTAPIIAFYVMMRVSGVSHHETVETASRAFRAAIREAPTLTDPNPHAHRQHVRLQDHPGEQNGDGNGEADRDKDSFIARKNPAQPPTDPNNDEPTYPIGDNQ